MTVQYANSKHWCVHVLSLKWKSMSYSFECSTQAKNVHWRRVEEFKELSTWEAKGREFQFLVSSPFVANNRTSSVYRTADCVPVTKTSHCPWRPASLLSYYRTVRKLIISKIYVDIWQVLDSRGIVDRFPAEQENFLFPKTCITALGPFSLVLNT
jgi:hypothetical protein